MTCIAFSIATPLLALLLARWIKIRLMIGRDRDRQIALDKRYAQWLQKQRLMADARHGGAE